MNGECLCLHCKRTNVTIHARGLCGVCYRDFRDKYPKTKHHKPYSAKEREFIRHHWGKLSCEEIAKQLRRNPRDVYAAAVRFGAAKPKHVWKTNKHLRTRIVRLHAQGLSDREIGKLVGFGHATVARWLRRAGLPSNCRTKPTDPFPERTRQKQRQHKLDQIKDEGVEAACAFLRKHAANRAKAVSMGWPQAETLLEARILDCLYLFGPSTTTQIVAVLGERYNWASHIVRDLKRRGLIAVLYREGRYCVYALAYGLTRTHPKRQHGEGPVPSRKPRGEGTPVRLCKRAV